MECYKETKPNPKIIRKKADFINYVKSANNLVLPNNNSHYLQFTVFENKSDCLFKLSQCFLLTNSRHAVWQRQATSPHSVLFRTILAFPSSKKRKNQHKVTEYIYCIFVEGKEKKNGGMVPDAVRKLCRQLIGNSRSISKKSGEMQETIFSILH